MRWWVATALSTACGRVAFDPVEDGGTTNGDALDATSPFCAGHTFCDDFDRTGAVLGAWETEVIETGVLQLDATPPQTLFVRIPTTVTSLRTALEVPVPTATIRTTLAFDMAHEQYETTREIDLVYLQWDVPPAGCSPPYGLFFVKRGGTMSVALQETYPNCGGAAIYQVFAPVDQALHRYELVIDYATDGITVRRDGGQLVAITAARDLAPDSQRLVLGIADTLVGNTIAWQLRYDNVVIDVE